MNCKLPLFVNNSRAGSENSDRGETPASLRPLHQAAAPQHRNVVENDRGT